MVSSYEPRIVSPVHQVFPAGRHDPSSEEEGSREALGLVDGREGERCKSVFYRNWHGRVIEMEARVEEIRHKILPILRRNGVKRAGIFGSVVRGEDREDSDIDILVDIESDMSLLDFVGLKLEIEQALGREVDLVEYGTIKPLLRERILGEQVAIL